jgi:hypothetical protein
MAAKLLFGKRERVRGGGLLLLLQAFSSQSDFSNEEKWLRCG